MRQAARLSPEAEHTVWWLLLCRAVERAARAAERAQCIAECEAESERIKSRRVEMPNDFQSTVNTHIDFASMGAHMAADALRARAEGGGR